MKQYEQPIHIVSAHVSELGITIAQLSVHSKSKEIPAMQELLKTLDLTDCVVVADALNTQKETVSIIVDKKTDYVLPVKENQSNLYKEIKEMFDYVLSDKVEQNEKSYNYTKVIENNHGRQEIRESYVKNDKIRMYEKSKITMYKHTFFFVYFLMEVYKNGKINSTIKDIERNGFKTKLLCISKRIWV